MKMKNFIEIVSQILAAGSRTFFVYAGSSTGRMLRRVMDDAGRLSPMKWIAGIAGIVTAGLILASIGHVATSLGDLSAVVARLDERTELQGRAIDEIKTRMGRIEDRLNTGGSKSR